MSKATKDNPETTEPPEAKSEVLPPRTEPATNLLIADIILRSFGGILHDTLEKRLLIANYDPDKARDRIDGRTVLTSLTLYGASRLATRSKAGLALVVGGLIAKTLYDRGKAVQRRKQTAEAEE